MFLQGGGTSQFSAVPLNLTQQGETVDYIVTGSWSKKAAEEAQAYGLKVNVAAKGDMASVPDRQSWNLSSDARYVCYCDNETIQVIASWNLAMQLLRPSKLFKKRLSLCHCQSAY